MVKAEPGDEEKNVVPGPGVSEDSVSNKPGGKKKIYSINGNVAIRKQEKQQEVGYIS